MNTYDLAELTAVLDRLGLARRLRIQTDNSILIPKHYLALIKDQDGNTIAGIRDDHYSKGAIAQLSGTAAYDKRARTYKPSHAYHADTYATALVTLLNDQLKYWNVAE